MSKRGITLAGVVLAIALAGAKVELTQRENDSIFANSLIPGAKAVKRTMTVADSAAARQARLDTAQYTP